MTNSLTNFLAICLTLAVSATALAQAPLVDEDSEPVKLVPARPKSLVDAPIPSDDEEEDEELPEPIDVKTPVIAPEEAISISQPAAISLVNFGLLDSKNGGFDHAVWNGTQSGEVAALIGNLPSEIKSRVLRDAVARLLMTSAEPPQNSDESFFNARLGALFYIGRFDDVVRMIAAVPASMQNDALRQRRADALLAKADYTGACADVAKAVENSEDLYWQKLSIFCRAREGKHDEARLGIDLLEEQGKAPSKWFSELIAALRDGGAKVKTIPQDIKFADTVMLLSAGAAKLPEGVAEHYAAAGYTPLLLAIGNNNGIAPTARAAALEKAVGLGMADANALRALYAEIAAEKTNAESDIGRRAALIVALQQEAKPTQKTKLLDQVVDGYYAADLGMAAAVLLTQELQNSRGHENASDAYALLMQTGMDADARKRASASAGALWLSKALADLRSGEHGVVGDIKLGADVPAREIKRIWRLYGLLPLFGFEIGDGVVNPTHSTRVDYKTALYNPLLFSKLSKAATERKKAAVLLQAAVLLSDPGRAHDTAVMDVVRALKNVGLGDVARELAIEATLALN